MDLSVKTFALLFTLATVHGKAIGEIKDRQAKKYLFKYGYTNSFTDKVPLEIAKLKAFQSYANIKVTGKLDDATITKMEEPRCGMQDPDALKIKTSGRARRYVHQGTNWKPLFRKTRKMELKWTLLNSGNSLPYKTVLKVIRQAIYFWYEKTNIDFIEIPYNKVGQKGYEKENIEILVSFERDVHNDPYAFDGQGGTLAHAFYPLTNTALSGDVHFDDDEYYTYKSPRGRNLLWVATHELGHSLGLEHSNVRSAVMYPWYTKYKPGFKLTDDDVLGIQTLYGSRTKPKPVDPSNPTTITTTTTTTTTTVAPPPPPSKGRCPRYGTITAVYYSQQYKQIFAFTDQNKIYFLGYRNRIPVVNRFSYYPTVAIPRSIDAIFTFDKIKSNGIKYQIIFSRNEYHVYYGFSRKTGPHSIYNYDGPLRLNFPSYIRHIDAAFTWPGNGRSYFFSGSQYWRYNNDKKQFDSNYPKPIYGNWPGLPRRIDSAYSSPDKQTTFFIGEGKYYLFDDKNIRVKAVYPIKQFLQCDGAAAISDNLSIGPYSDDTGLAIGSISDAKKPKEP